MVQSPLGATKELRADLGTERVCARSYRHAEQDLALATDEQQNDKELQGSQRQSSKKLRRSSKLTPRRRGGEDDPDLRCTSKATIKHIATGPRDKEARQEWLVPHGRATRRRPNETSGSCGMVTRADSSTRVA